MTERFELLEQLGRGGMGTVWKARDAETGEFVALKLLHQIYVDDPDYVARFEREVEIAQRINSPHVVKVLGYGKRDGVPYVAMEYVAGPSLRERLKADGPIRWWDDAKPIAIQLAQALAAAHAAGVIHRDIKPSNVLLDSDGNVKLADFGISRAADLTRMTGSATVMGTPAYMSPDGEANEQSDLYGLGCVLYEMLTGAPPFEGDSQQQVLLKHIREAPNLERLPASARRIVGWLLEKDPSRRPASAEALLAALGGSSVPAPAVAASPITRTRRRSRWVAVGLLGVAGIGVVGLGGLGAYARFQGGGGDGNPIVPAATETAVATPHVIIESFPSPISPTVIPSASTTVASTTTKTPAPAASSNPAPASPNTTATSANITSAPATPTSTLAPALQTPTSTPTRPATAKASPTPTPTFPPTPTPTATSTPKPIQVLGTGDTGGYCRSIGAAYSDGSTCFFVEGNRYEPFDWNTVCRWTFPSNVDVYAASTDCLGR